MTRYRLRFLLQEIDLVRTTTVIGRSPECHVTIEDPLVSRQHARIVLDEEGATIEDMRSRNGVKVNGRPIKTVTRLKDGDRVRIGTQEVVFCEVKGGAPRFSKTTGFLRHCAHCHLPYPRELTACPTCGSTELLDEDTMTGERGALSESSWSLQLLIEVLDKAISMGRTPEVIRTLQRMATEIDERLQSGAAIDPKQLALVAEAAARASRAAGDAGWVAWILRVHARVGAAPPHHVIEAIAELAVAHRATIRPALEEVAIACRASSASHDAQAVARLDQLLATIDLAERAAADMTAPNPAVRE